MNSSATIEIARPPHEVFDWVSDVSHDPLWRTGMTASGMLTDGPMRVGSSGFARAAVGRETVEAVWEVIEFDRPLLARWRFTSGPYLGTGGYVCEPIDGGTRFVLEADVRPAGWLRLLGPVFGLIGRRQNRRDVERLKELLEV